MSRRIKIIIVSICIIAGVALVLYPIINKIIVKDRQEKMISEFKNEILKNASENVSNNKNEEQGIEETTKIEEVIDLELEVDDSDNSDDNISSNSNLDNQDVIGIIEIEKLDIIFAIVEGAKKENIKVAIGHISGTADIGGQGNCVLAGHRGGIYGQFFKYINKLSTGDKVNLTDINGKEYTYKVYDSFVVEPTDTTVISDIEEKNTLTMITCENNGKKRLIVRAELVE